MRTVMLRTLGGTTHCTGPDGFPLRDCDCLNTANELRRGSPATTAVEVAVAVIVGDCVGTEVPVAEEGGVTVGQQAKCAASLHTASVNTPPTQQSQHALPLPGQRVQSY